MHNIFNVCIKCYKQCFLLSKSKHINGNEQIVSKIPTLCTLFKRTPENSSRASSPSCSDYENFPMVPTLETSYLARAGKNEFLNLVPDIEEMRPGWVMPCLVFCWYFTLSASHFFSPLSAWCNFKNLFETNLSAHIKTDPCRKYINWVELLNICDFDGLQIKVIKSVSQK